MSRNSPGNVIDIWTRQPVCCRDGQSFGDYIDAPAVEEMSEIVVEAPAEFSAGINWDDIAPVEFDPTGTLLDESFSAGIDWSQIDPFSTNVETGALRTSPIAAAPVAAAKSGGSILSSLASGIATGAQVANAIIGQAAHGQPSAPANQSAALLQQLLNSGAGNTAAMNAALANLQAHGYTAGVAQNVLQSQLDSQGILSMLTPTQWLMVGGAVFAVILITRNRQ